MPKKSTNAEMEQRTTIVYDMLLSGCPRAEIVQFAASKWEISERQTDTLIKRARKAFEKQADFVRDEQFGIALSRLNDLYQRSLKVQDYRVCLAVQRELHTLLALPIPQTLKIVAEVLTPADAKLLTELLMLTKAHNISAGDLFSVMMQEIATQVESEQSDE